MCIILKLFFIRLAHKFHRFFYSFSKHGIVSYETNLGQNEGGVKPYAVCYCLSSICSKLHIQTSPLFLFGWRCSAWKCPNNALIFLQQDGSCFYKIIVIKTKGCIKRETVLRTPTTNVGISWSSFEAGSDETLMKLWWNYCNFLAILESHVLVESILTIRGWQEYL